MSNSTSLFLMNVKKLGIRIILYRRTLCRILNHVEYARSLENSVNQVENGQYIFHEECDRYFVHSHRGTITI